MSEELNRWLREEKLARQAQLPEFNLWTSFKEKLEFQYSDSELGGGHRRIF